jgi:hypothetical protein
MIEARLHGDRAASARAGAREPPRVVVDIEAKSKWVQIGTHTIELHMDTRDREYSGFDVMPGPTPVMQVIDFIARGSGPGCTQSKSKIKSGKGASARGAGL